MLQKDERGHRFRYKFEVDWFSLGCLFHEFSTGSSPFKAAMYRNRQSTKDKQASKDEVDKEIDRLTLEYNPELNMDLFTAPGSADFCLRLLEKKRSHRLGVNGPQEVMDHPYFDDLNWDDIINETAPPPAPPRRDLNIGSQVTFIR